MGGVRVLGDLTDLEVLGDTCGSKPRTLAGLDSITILYKPQSIVYWIHRYGSQGLMGLVFVGLGLGFRASGFKV